LFYRQTTPKGVVKYAEWSIVFRPLILQFCKKLREDVPVIETDFWWHHQPVFSKLKKIQIVKYSIQIGNSSIQIIFLTMRGINTIVAGRKPEIRKSNDCPTKNMHPVCTYLSVMHFCSRSRAGSFGKEEDPLFKKDRAKE
jgi:hypothetical protein